MVERMGVVVAVVVGSAGVAVGIVDDVVAGAVVVDAADGDDHLHGAF